MHPSSLTPQLDIADQIRELIADQVTQADTATRYRPPLVAFARADDPRLEEMQRRIPGHPHPRDLLPEARSVCAFYLPFAPRIVKGNRPSISPLPSSTQDPSEATAPCPPPALRHQKGPDDTCTCSEYASRAWVQAYVETNALLSDLCATLVRTLHRRGVRAAWEPPTHNFDPVRLVSAWSHKSMAAIAGLGQFGHHHMLITEAGCAGRIGSLVLDVALPPTHAGTEPYCAYDRGCRVCVRRCPVGALTEEGFDRARCYARCRENDARYSGLRADVCGKCATGPCALRPMTRQDERLSEEYSSGL